MPLCRIKIHYPNSENWSVGDVVEISNSTKLIEEGKVELYVEAVVQEQEESVETVLEKVVVQPKKRGRKKK